jgi:hypothetical protein
LSIIPTSIIAEYGYRYTMGIHWVCFYVRLILWLIYYNDLPR